MEVKRVAIKKTRVEQGEWSLNVPREKLRETINPIEKLENLIINAALLSNGSFIRIDATHTAIKMKDVVGDTLIETCWTIPNDSFNAVATKLIHERRVSSELIVINDAKM